MENKSWGSRVQKLEKKLLSENLFTLFEFDEHSFYFTLTVTDIWANEWDCCSDARSLKYNL